MQPNIPSSILSFAVCGLKWILLFPCQINKIGLNSAKLNETMNAAEIVFPQAQLQACHFHYTQALKRNFSKTMNEAYHTNSEFSMLMKKLFGLAFVPPSDVPTAFMDIRNSTNFRQSDPELHKDIQTFFSYMENTYVGRRYSHPLFPVHYWNVHDRTMKKLPRTNNTVEAWNRRIGTLCESSHVPLYKLIEVLIREQHQVRSTIESRKAGADVKSKKYHQQQLDKRLHNLVCKYAETELTDFVEGIAHNMCTFSHVQRRKKCKSQTIDEPRDCTDSTNDAELNECDAETQRLEADQTLSLPSTSTITTFDRTFSTTHASRRNRGTKRPSQIALAKTTKRSRI
jgi:hypothetical protein